MTIQTKRRHLRVDLVWRERVVRRSGGPNWRQWRVWGHWHVLVVWNPRQETKYA